jgi:hypothetical protein
MGEVYEAQDQELGPVALKTIRRDLLGDRAVLRRFKHEVQLARQVTSPYICRIHELFMLPDGGEHRVAAFLTMELLKGTTLAKRIEHGPLPWWPERSQLRRPARPRLQPRCKRGNEVNDRPRATTKRPSDLVGGPAVPSYCCCD